jgi:hypothetical protein
MEYIEHNGRVAPSLFGMTAEGVTAGASVLGALGGLFGGGGGQTIVDDSKVRQQMQAREIAERQKEQAASRVQRAGEVQLQTQDKAARQRVEALDRIINTFQQNLRIR